MVTPLQLLRAVNSLAYRRRLEEGLSDLESTVLEYMRENETGQVKIGGYHVSKSNSEITIYELPAVDVDQLKLPFHFDEKPFKSEEVY